MKKIAFFVLVFLMFAQLVSCKKDDTAASAESESEAVEGSESEEVETAALDTMVSMYRAAIYKTPGQKKGEWVATLAKGEEVTLIGEETVTEGEKEIKYSLVKLSDDSEGYIKKSNLAMRAIVVIKDGASLYNRNNTSSGEYATVPVGTVLMVVAEKADWLKVKGSKLPNGKSVWNKWINDGYSESATVVADGVKFENASNIVSGAAEGDYDKAQAALTELAEKGGPIGDKAKEILDGGTGAGSADDYNYPAEYETAKVTATSLNLRSEASKDSDNVGKLPKNALVAIIEVKDEEVELSGKTGKWTKVYYKKGDDEAVEGWAFGAWLEKQ